MTIKVNIPVILKPVEVPDFIFPVDDGQPSFILKDLPWEALDKLCVEFRKTLFRKANKKDSKGL